MNKPSAQAFEVEQSTHLPVGNPENYKNADRYGFGPYFKARGIDIYGLENLPSSDEPYILASKHHSLLDVPVLGHTLLSHDGTQIHFVAKKELWNMNDSVASWLARKLKIGSYLSQRAGNWFGDALADYLESVDAIKFDRGMSMAKQPDVAEKVAYVLGNKGVLGMFPEKTRRPGAKLQVEERGLGIMAVASAVPIATVGLYGTGQTWGKIVVNIGKTSYPELTEDVNPRRRMVEMENEYQEYLQDASYGAYDIAGASY